MKESDFYAASNEKLLSPGSTKLVEEVRYKAVCHPPLPLSGSIFSANAFTYASLTPGSTSILGRFYAGNQHEQIGFIFEGKLVDGTYQVGPHGSYLVASATVGTSLITASSGTFSFVRDAEQETIKAEFDLQFNYAGMNYTLSSGTLFLQATGPL